MLIPYLIMWGFVLDATYEALGSKSNVVYTKEEQEVLTIHRPSLINKQRTNSFFYIKNLGGN